VWENCFFDPSTPAYTCSKKYDFGATFTHELGHAVGVGWHPNQVSDAAEQLAECYRYDGYGRPLWRATMCDSGGILDLERNKYRTERRTLESWDRESLRLEFVFD
jgi:hypothetical protein